MQNVETASKLPEQRAEYETWWHQCWCVVGIASDRFLRPLYPLHPVRHRSHRHHTAPSANAAIEPADRRRSGRACHPATRHQRHTLSAAVGAVRVQFRRQPQQFRWRQCLKLDSRSLITISLHYHQISSLATTGTKNNFSTQRLDFRLTKS